MELVSQEEMVVKCNHCHSICKTSNMKDFKDSGTYPPSAFFICPNCKMTAEVTSSGMPKRLFAALCEKVYRERLGNGDQEIFDRMDDI